MWGQSGSPDSQLRVMERRPSDMISGSEPDQGGELAHDAR